MGAKVLDIRNYLRRVVLVLLAASMLSFGATKNAVSTWQTSPQALQKSFRWKGHKDQRASWSRHNDPLMKLPGLRKEVQWDA